MAKAVTQFACTDCGYSAGRWFGKCPQCGEFGIVTRGRGVSVHRNDCANAVSLVADQADRVSKMRFDTELGDPSHLDSLLSTIRGIDSVYDAYRVVPGKG